MSSYLENVVKASGGHAAPAENLDSDKIEAPEGYHFMPDGTLMKDSEHAIEAEYDFELSDEDLATVEELQSLDDGEDFELYDPLLADGMLVPEEADLATALLEIVEKHGKFNDDNTGVWAGYDSAEKNAENAAIGVKCGNCVFWEAPNGCKIIIAETEEGGLCRFAILPDGTVDPDKKPVEEYFAKPPRLIQEELKKKIKEIENNYSEGYVEISDLTPTQEVVDTSEFKDASKYMEPIIVYKDEEGLKLVDGHHRCASRVQEGHGGIKAKIYQGPIIATAGSKPAPKKDRIFGSKKNKKGSAASGKGVKFSKKIEEALAEKAKKHNEDAPDGRKTSLRTLKAVYRRGAGAFSTSHRPDQNRNSWAMARVNAFLKLLKSGKPKNPKYITDNDLLPASHPKSSKTASGAISASAVEPMEEETMELANDPCWDGYVQVGMKKKNGKRVPNCVPSSATIDYVVEAINSDFGVSRHVSKENAYTVARKAVDKYEYLSDEDLYAAVLWEVQNFAEYATTGEAEDLEELSEYTSILPEGHPATEPSIVASAAWLAGASDFDNSSRDAVLTAFSESEDYIRAMHATTRLRAIISSGELSTRTLHQLKDLVARYSKVD